MSDLLARFAEASFWLARYMERAENVARLLDVTETFAGNRHDVADWLPIVEINSDAEPFAAKHGDPTVEDVIDFYVIDRDNPTSIIATIRMARENARMVRHLISTELWTHLNVFYGTLEALTPAHVRLSEVSRLCMRIKEQCQTHTGIAEGTLYCDQVWTFHALGRYLERADQTTRLLDIKYHSLLPSLADVGTPVDAAQWNAILRSVAGYHAYRRLHPRGLQPATVAGFLLLNRRFPRSVAHSVVQAASHVQDLANEHGLPGAAGALRTIEALDQKLRQADIGAIITTGLHEYLDGVQRRVIDITGEVGERFFGHEGVTA